MQARPFASLQKELCFLRFFPVKAISSSSSILCVRENARVRLFVREDVSCMINYTFFASRPLKRFRVAFSLLRGRSCYCLHLRVFAAEESWEFGFGLTNPNLRIKVGVPVDP